MDQTPRSAASGLGLHGLSMSHKKDVRIIWVNVGISIKGAIQPRN